VATVTATGILCVFAKNPEPGRVKTRLAAELGIDGAATLARALLVDTWQVAQAARQRMKPVLVLDGKPRAISLEPLPEVWSQGDGDLGARLERAFARALTQAPWVIAIGTDSPGLNPDWLRVAAVELETAHDAVIGPTRDGGYYLLGVRRCPSGLLADLPWSSTTTCSATLNRLRARGFKHTLLPPWFDVDEPADLVWLRAELSAQRLNAPHTAKALAELRAASAIKPR
jgi:hypothetical protein